MKNNSTIIHLALFILWLLPIPVQGQNGKWYADGQESPVSKVHYSSCVFEGKVYVIGGAVPIDQFQTCWFGSSTVEVYDLDNNTWDTGRKSMPTPRANASVEVVNGKFYVIGGISKAPDMFRYQSIEVYDPILDSWEGNAIPMLSRRYGTGTCLVDGKIFIIGGFNDQNQGVSTVEVFNPKLNLWEKKADMPTARGDISLEYLNGKIYAIGGVMGDDIFESASGVPLHNVEVYDVSTNTWMTSRILPLGLRYHSSFVDGEIIYMAGGVSNYMIKSIGEIHNSDIIAFDTRIQSFYKVTKMKQTGGNLAFHKYNNKFIILGGQDWNSGLSCSEEPLNLNLLYDPVADPIVATNARISATFIESFQDSVAFTCSFINPNRHQIKARALIINQFNVVIDSITLFDDGAHGDLSPNDGVYGNRIPRIKEENTYSIIVSTLNVDRGTEFISYDIARDFTSIGPLHIRGSAINRLKTDDPELSNCFEVSITLKNQGKFTAAENISLELFSADPSIRVASSKLAFGSIIAGKTQVSVTKAIIELSSGFNQDEIAKLHVSIESKGTSYWHDVLYLDFSNQKEIDLK